MKQHITVIGFDADDTLWVNEIFYRETEKEFVKLLSDFAPEAAIMKQLYNMEVRNLPLYGYGAKGFVLSMTETALKITDNKLPASTVGKIIDLGKTLLNKPVVLLDGVSRVLRQLTKKYPLILVTKGDLLDQERKLKKSGLDNYFHHIEIMSDKNEDNYRKLLDRLAITPKEFVMAGNSLKSDILPVLKLGAWGVHVPYHTTWIHEKTEEDPKQWKRFLSVEHLQELVGLLS